MLLRNIARSEALPATSITFFVAILRSFSIFALLILWKTTAKVACRKIPDTDILSPFVVFSGAGGRHDSGAREIWWTDREIPGVSSLLREKGYKKVVTIYRATVQSVI
jgi:hypothetical protein